MTSIPPTRMGTPADAARVGETITEAFSEDPLALWVVPQPTDRSRVLPGYFGAGASEALKAGSVYVVGDFDAIAVWFDVTQPHPPPPDDPPAELVELCGIHAENLHLLEKLMHEVHPSGPAHHHLAFIAVRRELRGRGVGSHLLQIHHDTLDPTGLGSYLDSSSPDSRRLYQRHGYRDLGEPFYPPGGPPVWPMWRPAGA